jgi:hypothetical protein
MWRSRLDAGSRAVTSGTDLFGKPNMRAAVAKMRKLVNAHAQPGNLQFEAATV